MINGTSEAFTYNIVGFLGVKWGGGGGGGRKGYMPHSKVSGFSKNAGVANGTSKNVGLGKFGQDLEISEAFLILDQKLR